MSRYFKFLNHYHIFFSFWQIVTEWSLDETKKNCPPELNTYTVNQNWKFHLGITYKTKTYFVFNMVERFSENWMIHLRKIFFKYLVIIKNALKIWKKILGFGKSLKLFIFWMELLIMGHCVLIMNHSLKQLVSYY